MGVYCGREERRADSPLDFYGPEVTSSLINVYCDREHMDHDTADRPIILLAVGASSTDPHALSEERWGDGVTQAKPTTVTNVFSQQADDTLSGTFLHNNTLITHDMTTLCDKNHNPVQVLVVQWS